MDNKVVIIDKNTGNAVDLISLEPDFIESSLTYPTQVGFCQPIKKKIINDDGIHKMIVEHKYDTNKFTYSVLCEDDTNKMQKIIKNQIKTAKKELQKLDVIKKELQKLENMLEVIKNELGEEWPKQAKSEEKEEPLKHQKRKK